MFKKKLQKVIKSKLFFPAALYVVMDIILLSFIIFFGFAIQKKYAELQKIETDITDLKASVDLIKANKGLVQDNVTRYNELLDKLIPSSETYFQVISALEKLGNETGIVIQSYSIDLSETTENKLSLSLTVGGDRESVENLLDRYAYSSGRLITNQGIQLDMQNLETFAFDINMIHLPEEDFVLPDTVAIEQEDIKLLDRIEKEM